MSDDFPMGNLGCKFSMGIGFYMATVTMMSIALISHDRRQSICSLKAPRSSSRFPEMTSAIFVLTVGAAFLWALPLNFMDGLRIVETSISGVNDDKPVKVCTMLTYKMPLFIELLFILVTFIIPVAFTSINYGFESSQGQSIFLFLFFYFHQNDLAISLHCPLVSLEVGNNSF